MTSDSRNLYFEPVFVQFNQSAAPNPGFPAQKSIGFMLAFSSSPITLAAGAANADIAKAASISIPINLGTMERGRYIETSPSAFSQPPGSRPVDVFYDQRRALPITLINDPKNPKPVNAYAFVTESADAGFFDKLLLQSVSDSNFQSLLTSAANQIAGVKNS